MVEENAVPNDAPVEQPAEETPIVRVAPPESRFLFVDVAALRAKQLRRGARVRIPGGPDGEPPADLPRKPERIAMLEVREGLVSFELGEIKPEEDNQ